MMTRQGHIQGLHQRDHPEKPGGTSQDQNRKMHWVATSAIKAAGAELDLFTVHMAKVGMLESLI
jgi:predicted cobalt transporter CbtA